MALGKLVLLYYCTIVLLGNAIHQFWLRFCSISEPKQTGTKVEPNRKQIGTKPEPNRNLTGTKPEPYRNLKEPNQKQKISYMEPRH